MIKRGDYFLLPYAGEKIDLLVRATRSRTVVGSGYWDVRSHKDGSDTLIYLPTCTKITKQEAQAIINNRLKVVTLADLFGGSQSYKKTIRTTMNRFDCSGIIELQDRVKAGKITFAQLLASPGGGTTARPGLLLRYLFPALNNKDTRQSFLKQHGRQIAVI
jgi:hypothetical protein